MKIRRMQWGSANENDYNMDLDYYSGEENGYQIFILDSYAVRITIRSLACLQQNHI